MTLMEHTDPTTATAQDTRAAWVLNVDHDAALGWVRRKLPKARSIATSLYYHPMLGSEFDWYGPRGKKITINILVDLVSGRAFAATPWTAEHFTAPAVELQAENAHAIDTPPARVELSIARQNARKVAEVLVMRKRRFAGTGRLETTSREIEFLKPNWWVTGAHRGRDLELILDGVTGKHYVFSA